jgi:hypothetical protein
MKSLLASLAVIGAFGFCAAIAISVTVPCAVEDDRTCYWDATQSGNGQGQSFVDILGFRVQVGR